MLKGDGKALYGDENVLKGDGNSPVILLIYLKIIAAEGFSQHNVLLVSLE